MKITISKLHLHQCKNARDRETRRKEGRTERGTCIKVIILLLKEKEKIEKEIKHSKKKLPSDLHLNRSTNKLFCVV